MFKDVQEERGREPSYSHEWGATAILPGKFGGGALAPIHGVATDYRYFWLTFGGEDTDSTSWMDTAENDIVKAGAHGAAFDIEGGVTPKDMHEWIQQMRAKHPKWTYVYIPQAADKMVGYTDDGPNPDPSPNPSPSPSPSPNSNPSPNPNPNQVHGRRA
jgi:hypothetical protein